MTILLPRKRSRRGALRAVWDGAVVSVGLPFLDYFLNDNGTALAATGAPLPVRFATWYWGLGHTPGYAVTSQSKTAQGIEFLEECKALIPYRDAINYYGGFNTPLDGKSNFTHFSGLSAGRTGTAPSFNGDFAAPTLDILVGDAIGPGSRFQNLDASSIGMAEENYSARSTNSRSLAEVSALALYARIFGIGFADPNSGDFRRDPRVVVRKSALSLVREQSNDLNADLGASDRARLDEYFTSIRQVERQLELQLEPPAPNQACIVPREPTDTLNAERKKGAADITAVIATHQVMSKLLAMAVACNQTKVVNMVFSDSLSHMRREGEATHHHQLTHEEPIDTVRNYQPGSFWFGCRSMEAFATFIGTFASIREGATSLLDNMLIYAGTEAAYARLHSIDGIPMFTVGRAGGRIKTGYHVFGGGDPVTRVGLTAMQAVGVPIETWGTKSLETSKPISELFT